MNANAIAAKDAELAKLKATLADRETEIARLKEGIPKPAWSAHWRKRVERWVETIENVRKPSWPDGTPVRVKQMERELKHYLEFGLLQMKDTTEQSQWVSVDEFDYNVSHICIIAWARKMPMSMGSYEDGYFTLYDTEDCGIFEGDAEWFKDNFEFYMPSPLQPARSST